MLTFLDAEIRGDPKAISRFSTMGSVAGGGDGSVWLYKTACHRCDEGSDGELMPRGRAWDRNCSMSAGALTGNKRLKREGERDER